MEKGGGSTPRQVVHMWMEYEEMPSGLAEVER